MVDDVEIFVSHGTLNGVCVVCKVYDVCEFICLL